MIRALAIVPAPIGGPIHVSRVPDGTRHNASSTAARPVRQVASNSGPGVAAPCRGTVLDRRGEVASVRRAAR